MLKVTIYTDGACIGNPGPMGIGVVLQCNGHQLKVARYIGKLEVVKVTAHADDMMNNTVDKLARKAAKTKKSFEERK